MGMAAWVAAAALVCGCGYRSTRTSTREAATYCVRHTHDVVPDPRVAAALENGVRSSLSRFAALGPCDRSRVVRVRLLEVVFEPVGIVASPNDQVTDRGMRARVTAYAEIEAEGVGARATPGQITEDVVFALGSGGPAESRARQEAAAAAARRVGEAIGSWAVGEPHPGTGTPDP